MPEPLVLVMAAFALLSVVLLVSALVAVRKRRWMGMGMALVLALLSLALAALAATISLATRGYQALTRETVARSEEHTSELQSRLHLVCRLLLEKKKTRK